MPQNLVLLLAVVAIAGALIYALSPSKRRAPIIEPIPPGERHRFVSLERLIEDHLDEEDERIQMRRETAIRAAKKARAREAVKKLAGDPEAAAAAAAAPAPN